MFQMQKSYSTLMSR